MKAIILAAGEGTRMRPLTETKPKQMVIVADKTLLDYQLEALPEEITELIVVIGYRGEQIQEHLGAEWNGRKVMYVRQEQKRGPMDALERCRPLLTEGERFLVMYADDIHGKAGIQKCVDLGKPCVLVAEVEDPRKFGVLEADEHDRVISIEEKPEHPKSNLISNGVMVLDTRIFLYPGQPHANGERYIPDNIANMIAAGEEVYIARATFWAPVNYPEDVQRAEETLAKVS